MLLIKPLHSLRAFFSLLCLALWLMPALAIGEELEDTSELFSAWQETTSSASRVPKPLSQTAENTTVITATEIRLLNAHTLADILDTIPGIQIQHNGGPGITAYTFIQSANPFFSQLFVDGISLNNLGSNYADISSIPTRIIERIEIVKGSASSAWGSALGGVINVITKSPEKNRAFSGSANVSIGERTTADTGAELSGSTGRLGYYLSGGYLGSDGLLPTMQIGSNNAYAKLTYDLPNNGLVWSTFRYSRAGMGDLFAQGIDLRERQNKLNRTASLGLRYNLATDLELEVNASHSAWNSDLFYFNISDGNPRWSPDSYAEQARRGNAKLLWRKGDNTLAVGAEYAHLNAEYVTVYNQTKERWGAYLNDTLVVGPVSISPGIRVDRTQDMPDQISPSFGVTWQINGSNLLRAYTGRGFNQLALGGNDAPSQRIFTTQVGAESTAIPYLWVKGTLFRNMTWGPDVEQNLALGSELELRTTPVFNTSLGAGWTYTETTRTSDGSAVQPDRPTQTVKVSVRYLDSIYRAVLTGSHINWNPPPDFNGKLGVIWDLHLGATLCKRQDSSLELFFSGHNLFDGKNYYRDLVPNTGRWFEGGVRVNF